MIRFNLVQESRQMIYRYREHGVITLRGSYASLLRTMSSICLQSAKACSHKHVHAAPMPIDRGLRQVSHGHIRNMSVRLLLTWINGLRSWFWLVT